MKNALSIANKRNATVLLTAGFVIVHVANCAWEWMTQKKRWLSY